MRPVGIDVGAALRPSRHGWRKRFGDHARRGRLAAPRAWRTGRWRRCIGIGRRFAAGSLRGAAADQRGARRVRRAAGGCPGRAFGGSRPQPRRARQSALGGPRQRRHSARPRRTVDCLGRGHRHGADGREPAPGFHGHAGHVAVGRRVRDDDGRHGGGRGLAARIAGRTRRAPLRRGGRLARRRPGCLALCRARRRGNRALRIRRGTDAARAGQRGCGQPSRRGHRRHGLGARGQRALRHVGCPCLHGLPKRVAAADSAARPCRAARRRGRGLAAADDPHGTLGDPRCGGGVGRTPPGRRGAGPRRDPRLRRRGVRPLLRAQQCACRVGARRGRGGPLRGADGLAGEPLAGVSPALGNRLQPL